MNLLQLLKVTVQSVFCLLQSVFTTPYLFVELLILICIFFFVIRKVNSNLE